jgi:hypothetical protein
MIATYNFVANLAFYRKAIARFRRQKVTRRRKFLAFAIVALLLASAWLYAWSTNANWAAIPALTLGGGLIGGALAAILDWALLPSRMKRFSPEYGTEVTIILGEDGLEALATHVREKLEWPAFSEGVRFPDGTMLLRGRIIRWLPDSALKDATPEQVSAFVRSKLRVRDVD